MAVVLIELHKNLIWNAVHVENAWDIALHLFTFQLTLYYYYRWRASQSINDIINSSQPACGDEEEEEVDY